MNLIEIEGSEYRLGQKLPKQGREGDIYSGLNIQTNENVIIKISESQPKNEEIKILKMLKQSVHLENIIKILGLKIEKDKAIIIMEHGGQDLENYLNQNRNKLSKQQLMNIFLQIVKGVKEFHELNFIHRDLKPENFAINQEEVIKLIDFKTSREDSGREKTIGVGTKYYAAPETYSNQYDISVDIWSVGCILYELLTQEVFNKKINIGDQSQIDLKIEKSKLEQNEKSLLQQMLQVVPEQRSKIQIIFEAIQNFKTQQQQCLQTTFIKSNFSQLGGNSINVGGQLYQIIQILGEGSQVTIYKGESLQTGEEVAIKISNQLSQTEYDILQELQKMPQQNIIGIKAVQRDCNGKVKIVMELADQELYEYMTNNPEYRALTKYQKTQMFAQIVMAVNELHQLGYFHRDLKPENFVVFKKDQNGFVRTKLIDLGLAKQKANLTHTKNIGTPYYMAPEIFDGSSFYDNSVDSWALGCIWFEMLTGETLFQGTSQNEIYQQIKFSSIDMRFQKFSQLFDGEEKKQILKLIDRNAAMRDSAEALKNYFLKKGILSNINQNQPIKVNQQPQLQLKPSLQQLPQLQQQQFQQQQFTQQLNFFKQNQFQLLQPQQYQFQQQLQQPQFQQGQSQPNVYNNFLTNQNQTANNFSNNFQQVQKMQQQQQLEIERQQALKQQLEKDAREKVEQEKAKEIEKIKRDVEQNQQQKNIEFQRIQELQIKLKEMEEEQKRKNKEAQKKIEQDKIKILPLKIEQELQLRNQMEQVRKQQEGENQQKQKEFEAKLKQEEEENTKKW